MPLGVERDDLELERLALVDDVTRMGDALVRQLADVDQAFEAVPHPDERAEVDQLGDRAVDDVADLEVRHRGMPRVGLQAADRQADPATLVVDVDDLGLDLLADLVAGLGVVDLVPRELALVDEAIDATEIDEHAERRDRADRAGDLLADLQAAEQLVALLAALLVQGDLLRQDQAVRLAVDLEDLEPELAADERHELLGDLLGGVARLVVLGSAREVDDLADRHEAADAAVDDEAALVVVDDRRLDDDARLELLLHRAPLALETGAAERQDDVALGRFRLEDVDQDRIPDGQLGLALAMATEQLAVADDALALGPDVDQDLVLVDADDLALDDVAVLEALDVGILLGEQLLHRRRLGSERTRRRRLLLVIARGGRVGGLLVGQRVVGWPGPPSLPDGPARCRRQVPPARARGRAGSLPAARDRAVVRPLPARWLRGRRCWWRARRRRRPPRRCLRTPGRRRRRWPPAPAWSRPAGCRSTFWSLLVMDSRPRITNGLSDAQAVSETIEVVRGDRLRGPLLRASNGSMSLVRCPCPLGPGESSTGLPTATIAAPCPNCPI